MSPGLEGRAAISGIGQSDVGRRLERDPLALTVDACLAAIDDAGLRREDVDGLSTYPGSMGAGAPGFSGAGVQEVQDALRLELDWFCGGPELPGQLGSVINACMAVATGLAKHVLCFRTVWESTAQRGRRRAGIGAGGGSGFRATGFLQWSLPFGAASAANWVALFAQRHFHEYGTTREQLGQVALNARRNAAHNPRAVYRDPLTLDDYLSARPISTPLGLFDCDVPVDGSTACVVSRRATRRGCSGRAPRSGPRTCASPSSTTASASSRSPGSRRSGSAARARAGLSWRGARPSPWTGSSRSTPAEASSRAAACTATGSFTRPCCSCAATAARGR